MHSTNIKHLSLGSLAAAVLLLTACDDNPEKWKTPNMTALTPRLQAVFDKTKTVCFGRFMVDVPASATVVWGNVDIPLGVTVYPGGANNLQGLAQGFIDELKGEKAINHDDVPLLLSIHDVVQPEGKIVTGYEDFQSINDLKINGYFKLNNDGFIIYSRPLRDEKDETIADIISIARRLRQRAENEVPTEPGNCIEHAFLPDKPGENKEPPRDLIRIGFRLQEFPDTHLSIFVGPSNPHYTESSSLEWQLDRLEKNLNADDTNHPRLKTKYFRRGKRQIHNWLDGFEALSRSPEQVGIHSTHDFGMDFKGVPSDPLRPYADIRMQTGVADNAAGATRPSLTDEEAIAVWDKITSTIRVRPTSATPTKSAAADPRPQVPLGELAATGRTCPQTGWWVSDESGNIENGQRQHFRSGERMPHVVSLGEPSLWQKLKGERPSFRTATVWKLVAYGDAPAQSEVATHTPPIAQAFAADNSPDEESSPKKKG